MQNQNQDKYFTDLDKDLQQLAAVDWPAFVELIGEESVISAKICVLKSRGKSQNQIALRLNITRSKAQRNCQTCHTPVK